MRSVQALGHPAIKFIALHVIRGGPGRTCPSVFLRGIKSGTTMRTLVAVELPGIQATMLVAQREMRQAYEDLSGVRRCLSESPINLRERWRAACRAQTGAPLGLGRFRCGAPGTCINSHMDISAEAATAFTSAKAIGSE
jgi:hypothetical protein